jgi:thymidylate synthase (FAD)
MPQVVKAGVLQVLGLEDGQDVLHKIEHCGRIAYRTWDREAEGTAEKFVRMIIKLGHESVLEHVSVSVLVKCDRATAQQITRHRVASYTMESQRYCNYSLDRFQGAVEFVDPEYEGGSKQQFYECWLQQIQEAERAYLLLTGTLKVAPEDARAVLPNSAATTLAITANLREWRHIFELRTEAHAQHNIRKLMGQVLEAFRRAIPCVVEDIPQ